MRRALTVGDAYGASAGAWAAGPDLVYQALADDLVGSLSLDPAGRPVVDIGAGTGTVSRALVAAGADPVAVDLSAQMLGRLLGPRRIGVVVGDAMSLPFPDGAFGAAVAGFCLSHLPDPVAGVKEAARVTRAGGLVAASSFSSRSSHPAKNLVEQAAVGFGWRPPRWYRRLKDELEPRTAEPVPMGAIGERAGLAAVHVAVRPVDFGCVPARALVAWRLGMAHVAPFVASLEPSRRAALVAEAEAAVGPRPDQLRLVVLVMTGRAGH